jgi:hypothetical protein
MQAISYSHYLPLIHVKEKTGNRNLAAGSPSPADRQYRQEQGRVIYKVREMIKMQRPR